MRFSNQHRPVTLLAVRCESLSLPRARSFSHAILTLLISTERLLFELCLSYGVCYGLLRSLFSGIFDIMFWYLRYYVLVSYRRERESSYERESLLRIILVWWWWRVNKIRPCPTTFIRCLSINPPHPQPWSWCEAGSEVWGAGFHASPPGPTHPPCLLLWHLVRNQSLCIPGGAWSAFASWYTLKPV